MPAMVFEMVIRRLLTAGGLAGLAVIVSGLAASSVWAAPGQPDRDSRAPDRGSAGLLPRSDEWWLFRWGVRQQVWPLSEGTGVTVAVLDSGVQASVPDLRGVVLPGGDATGHHTNGETDFNTIGDGHGTMMSVLIAGRGFGTGMAGIAPGAQILPVVVNAGALDTSAAPGPIAAGIEYAVNQGAQVISIPQAGRSLSASGCDSGEQAAVAYALSRDVVVVAAAGNTTLTGTGPVQPASCAGVLAVGAVQQNGSLWPGSTRQPYVAVAAPGADLVTSGRDGRLVAGVEGTRSASALVSGAVALIRSRYPLMPWYRVIQRLTGTALPAGGKVPNDSFGYGLVRLGQAVNATAYPVSASAPNPVYAKYQAWLATPQGQSISRQLAGSASPSAQASRPAAATSQTGKGGSGPPTFIAAVVVLIVLGGGPALAVVKHRRRRRSRHAIEVLFEPTGPVFPGSAGAFKDAPYDPEHDHGWYSPPGFSPPPDPGRYRWP
jgi:subtilisin family serine protease